MSRGPHRTSAQLQEELDRIELTHQKAIQAAYNRLQPLIERAKVREYKKEKNARLTQRAKEI